MEKPEQYILETFHFGDEKQDIMTRWTDRSFHDTFEDARQAAFLYMMSCEFIGYKISYGDDLIDSRFDRAGYVAKNMTLEKQIKLRKLLRRSNTDDTK